MDIPYIERATALSGVLNEAVMLEGCGFGAHEDKTVQIIDYTELLIGKEH